MQNIKNINSTISRGIDKIPINRSYADVNLVKRTLSVLASINRLKLITVSAISNDCKIPSSSVIRILETLCNEGYLIKISRRGGYAVTSKVKLLSSGFNINSIIFEIVQPILDRLTKEYLWPFAVATLETNNMVIQYSSIPSSPLAHVKSTLNKRLSLLSRAHGLAYIAFCNINERKLLIKLALELNNLEDRVISSNYQWRRLIRQTRKLGYATRISKIDETTNTIAIPIYLQEGYVIATIGVTYFKKAVKTDKIDRMINSLKKEIAFTVEEIKLRI